MTAFGSALCSTERQWFSGVQLFKTARFYVAGKPVVFYHKAGNQYIDRATGSEHPQTAPPKKFQSEELDRCMDPLASHSYLGATTPTAPPVA